MSETVPVRAGSIPVELYLHLLPTAEALGVSIFDLLVELARRELAKPQPPRRTPRMPFAERLERNPRAKQSWTGEHTHRLRQLHGEGRTDPELAVEIGFSRKTIARHRTALGLTRNEPREDVKAA